MYNYGYKSRRIVLKMEFALDIISKVYFKYDDCYLTIVYYTVW